MSVNLVEEIYEMIILKQYILCREHIIYFLLITPSSKKKNHFNYSTKLMNWNGKQNASIKYKTIFVMQSNVMSYLWA